MSWGVNVVLCWAQMFPEPKFSRSGLANRRLAQWLTNFAITFTFPIFWAGIGLAAA